MTLLTSWKIAEIHGNARGKNPRFKQKMYTKECKNFGGRGCENVHPTLRAGGLWATLCVVLAQKLSWATGFVGAGTGHCGVCHPWLSGDELAAADFIEIRSGFFIAKGGKNC